MPTRDYLDDELERLRSEVAMLRARVEQERGPDARVDDPAR
jgi:hypothetical protein